MSKVVAQIPEDPVVDLVTADVVVAGDAVELVVPGAAADGVVATQTSGLVIAAESKMTSGTGVPPDDVVVAVPVMVAVTCSHLSCTAPAGEAKPTERSTQPEWRQRSPPIWTDVAGEPDT